MIAQTNTVSNASAFDLETPVLETKRLMMRPPHRADIEDLAIIGNDRDIAEMTSRMPHPYTQDDALAFIEGFENGQYEGCIYAITVTETGRLIGMGAVENRARFGGLEIGYWLGKPFWGKGFATEAASALVDLAFRVTETDVVLAACRTNNPASRKVLQKQGFEFLGLDEMDSRVAGRVPIERHSLERETWLAKKAEESQQAAQ